MSFNGSGTFVINSSGQPVVANTVISATVFNALTADLATGLSTCITKDGQTTPTANIPMGTFKFTGLGNGSAATDSATLGQVQASTTKLVTVSGTDTITGTMTPALTAYASGQMFYFVAGGANTGAVTLNIDGLGARNVTRHGSVALVAGDILSGEVCVVVYDGTRFQLLNPASYTNLGVTGNLTLSGGTANGVAYLNASKVVTSGSALVFDGTNLGIGITPRAWGGAYKSLDINGPTALASTISGDTFTQLANGAWFNGTNWIYQYTGVSAARYQMTGPAGGANHAWFISPTGTAGNAISFTQAMTLDASGNLGIGTASPTFGSGTGVEIQRDGIATLRLENFTASNSFELYADSAANGINLRGRDSSPMVFWTANTERMRLDSSGNLGIGTASPSYRLDVVDAGGNLFRFTRSTDQLGAFVSSGTCFFGGISNSPLGFVTNNTERMRITATGNIVAGASAALATNATDGFLYVPTCAGTPTGTPTAITGMAPVVVNTTNNKLYFYSGGAWRDAGP